MAEKSLERRLAAIHADPNCSEFIIADAKDADMGAGISFTGPGFGDPPNVQTYRQRTREVIEQGIVDLVLMSASTNEMLALQERMFDDSSVTAAARANDTTDIWLSHSPVYREYPSRPFSSTTIDHIQCGKLECSNVERDAGTDLGLYSMTFNNDPVHDLASLEAFKAFRLEAEAKQFRYFLEVFAPNVPGTLPEDEVGRFLNDHIIRALAGVTDAGRPVMLKIPYCGPGALEELVAYDTSVVVGILGGASGTTHDSFTLLSDVKKHGARAAIFGRRISNAEDQLLFIELLRRVADDEVSPREAVELYHAGIKERGIAARRSLEDDLKLG